MTSPAPTYAVTNGVERHIGLSLWRGLISVGHHQAGAKIIAEVAAQYGLTREDLVGPSHRRDVAWPRQEAMWRIRQMGWSFPRIGRLFNRDHSTALYGTRRYLARLMAAGTNHNPEDNCDQGLMSECGGGFGEVGFSTFGGIHSEASEVIP